MAKKKATKKKVAKKSKKTSASSSSKSSDRRFLDPNKIPKDRWMSTKEAAEFLNMSYPSVTRYIRLGELGVIDKGERKNFVDRKEVENLKHIVTPYKRKVDVLDDIDSINTSEVTLEVTVPKEQLKTLQMILKNNDMTFDNWVNMQVSRAVESIKQATFNY